MSVLNILEFPDDRLRIKAVNVEAVDDEIKKLIDDMFETMYSSKGVGLAATQVNIHKRVIVIDVSESKDSPMSFINPEIMAKQGLEETEEGCLSVPGFFEKVQRSEKVTIKALGKDGLPLEMEVDDFLAVCIQHEMDHLEGKLFVDYLSPLKRQRIKKKLEKIHKLERDAAKAKQIAR